jgi:hypothetical protein
MGVHDWFSKRNKLRGNIRSQNVRLMLQALDERAVPDATVLVRTLLSTHKL